MRFFWKIFFTTMFLAVSCTALTGYALIRSNVTALLEADAVRTVEAGSVAAYALAAATGGQEEQVRESVSFMDISYGGEPLRFLVLDETGELVFSSLDSAHQQPLASLQDAENQVWHLAEVNGGIFVEALRPVRLGESLFYIGTARSVDSIFSAQLRQYRQLLWILGGTVAIGGAVTLVLSRLLTRKLKAVIRASRSIASGQLDCRAAVRGQDEFAQLAAQFNQMADALEEKIAALREENERRTLFVGAFAHELKTPLTSIIGYADLLRVRARDQRTALCAGYIFSEGRRLESLSMRLLDLIVLQQHRIQPETVEARRFFRELALAVVGAGVAPEWQTEPAKLRMEPGLMHTVFLNLLDNARKAAGAGGHVSLTGQRRGEDYVVTIRDDGPGMAPEELQKIRRPFYRVDPSRARAQGGAGLGVAICDRILTLHGFSLSYESAPGQGTAAVVTMKKAVVG